MSPSAADVTSARRVALVTGAASGIGAATTSRLLEAGWLVAGLDRAPVAGASTSRVVDVTVAAAVSDAVASVVEEMGTVTGMVAAAGSYEQVPLEDLDDATWSRMLAVHLGGFANCARAVLSGMVARGEGAIVAVVSELAVGGGSGDAHYAAAKGAVIGLVRSLAAEVAPHGVRVNAVAPGPTDTPLLAADSPWREASYLATLPAGRLARPQEIATVIDFLLSSGSFVVGEVVGVNSGAVI